MRISIVQESDTVIRGVVHAAMSRPRNCPLGSAYVSGNNASVELSDRSTAKPLNCGGLRRLQRPLEGPKRVPSRVTGLPSMNPRFPAGARYKPATRPLSLDGPQVLVKPVQNLLDRLIAR